MNEIVVGGAAAAAPPTRYAPQPPPPKGTIGITNLLQPDNPQLNNYVNKYSRMKFPAQYNV